MINFGLNQLTKKIILGCGALLITSCVVGPNYHRPPPPPVNRFTGDLLPGHTTAANTLAGKAQYFKNGQDIPGQWWKIFHSKPLDQLIRSALQANPDLQAADAGLRIAQETALAQRALFSPRADFNFNASRQETAHTLQSNLASNGYFYNLYVPQFTISYVPDVFGQNRRRVESLEAEIETAIFRREAISLTITSNVVMAVIQEASLRAQIKATRHSIAIAKKQLKLLNIEHEAGEIGLEGVAAQEAVLAQTQAFLPPLQKQLAQQRHLISVLCGHFPSENFLYQFKLNSFNLPRNLPVSIPSALVEQRPDIRAASAQIHSASALIGVAIAQRLPNISLSATIGSAALNLNTVFNQNTIFWTIAGNLAQPIYDAGLLLHKQRAAVENFKQADAQYRTVVLTAFRDVADTLKAIEYDANMLTVAQIAAQASHKSLYIAQQQWRAGNLGYLAVLNAEQTHQQALVTLAQSQANRLIDTVALFQALGGGWWNRGLALSKVSDPVNNQLKQGNK